MAGSRITDNDLRAALARLNTATGSPTAAWHIVSTDADGRTRMESNVGHWHLNQAYGLTQLARMHNEHGGIESFGPLGTKREAFTRIHAMLDALRLAADDAATRVAQATERREALRWALDQIADDLDPDHQAALREANYAARVDALEAEGMTTSDAQAVASAEQMGGAQ